jgi:hypothetical protein
MAKAKPVAPGVDKEKAKVAEMAASKKAPAPAGSDYEKHPKFAKFQKGDLKND